MRFDVVYPERMARWRIFQGILILPSAIVVAFLSLAMGVTTVIAIFAIFFTQKYPESLWRFGLGVSRWSARVSAYSNFLTDVYPPYSFDVGTNPVAFDIVRPERMAWWRPLQVVLLIPHIFVLGFLGIAMSVTTFIAWFAILFVARYPEGLWRFGVGVSRWSNRVSAYLYLLTDVYPPYSFD